MLKFFNFLNAICYIEIFRMLKFSECFIFSDVLFSEYPNSSDVVFFLFRQFKFIQDVVQISLRYLPSYNIKPRSRGRKLSFLTRAAASSLVGRENKRVFILSFYFSWHNPAISNCIRHTGFRDKFSFTSRAWELPE